MKSIEQMIEQEEREREEYESRTVVTDHVETIAMLRKVFNSVCNQDHWKNEWSAKVPHQLVGAVTRAVEFFHADIPQVVGVEPITGLVIMHGKGYSAY